MLDTGWLFFSSTLQEDPGTSNAGQWVQVGNLANVQSGGSVSWVNGLDDTNTIFMDLRLNLNQDSYFLNSENLGGVSFPKGTTISGVEIRVRIGTLYNSFDPSFDKLVQLRKAGTRQGDIKALSSLFINSYRWDSYGGVEDLWGLELSPSDVEASDFGFSFQITDDINSHSTQCKLEAVQMKVYYKVSDMFLTL